MAGLFAARVLSEHFGRVTVVERDRFPEGPGFRRGVAQSKHLHLLMARGRLISERLFPGLGEDLRAVCGNGTKHRIENEVLGKERVAFNAACQYPDGTRVLAATTIEVLDGEIVREVSVEAWDE